MTSRYFPLCNHITSVSQPHNPKKPPYINLLSSNNCQQLRKSKLSFYHYCFLNQQNNTKKCGQRHMHLFLQTISTKLMTAKIKKKSYSTPLSIHKEVPCALVPGSWPGLLPCHDVTPVPKKQNTGTAL